MHYYKKDSASTSEIFLEDKLVVTDRDEFNKVVQNFIKSPKKNLIINFQNTNFLDTSSFGSLLLAQETVNEAKKNLILKNPKNYVKNWLNMMNFSSIFKVVTSDEF